MITNIIFDNNGVLTTSDEELTFKKVSDFLKIPIEKVQLLFDKHVEGLNRGKIKQNEFYSLALKEGGFDVSVKEFSKVHLSGYIPKSDVQEFAKSLKSNYHVSLLSNFGDAFWEMYGGWGLGEIFEKKDVLVSADIGMVKPDKEIFLEALKRLNVCPESSVFIDDNLENVVSAGELGINAIRFVSLEQVKQDLDKLGVLK